jgi:hypothetical protein
LRVAAFGSSIFGGSGGATGAAGAGGGAAAAVSATFTTYPRATSGSQSSPSAISPAFRNFPERSGYGTGPQFSAFWYLAMSFLQSEKLQILLDFSKALVRFHSVVATLL